jgi:protein required for attachment to host cells
MNQTEMVGAVGKMQLYVALAEKEISRRKMESQSLRDELERSQRLMQSLQEKLRQAEEYVVRQQSVKRISQFKMPKKVSGGTIKVCMLIAEPSQCELTNRIGCQRKGCCMLE